MTCRVVILGLGLSLLACRMDNPAFDLDSGAELSDETRGSDSTVSPGDGDGDGEPSESSESSSETTDGDCAPGSSCGPCQICDEAGECVIDVGGVCDGPALHCADYLYGASETACYRLADVTLAGRCSEQGLCESSLPSECPLEKGAVHFACDGACVTNIDSCAPLAKASEVEMSAMCLVEGEQGPGCTSKCANGIESVIENHGCVLGECQPLGAVSFCEGYVCDEQRVSCLESCETDTHCSQDFICAEGQCLPG